MREQTQHHTGLNKRPFSDRAVLGTPSLRLEDTDVRTKNKCSFCPRKRKTIMKNFNM